MLYKRKVFSFNSQLDIVTGVQRVLLDVHNALKDDYEAKIVGQIPFERINPSHGIKRDGYAQCRNPFMFRKSIVILHERKFLFLFWLLNHLLFQRIKIVYVHHNMLYGHKYMTMIPNTVVCISDKGRENLIKEFNVKPDRIRKIHNCVNDRYTGNHQSISYNQIKVLYPARINGVKRQVEIVKRFRGRLDERVQLLFAGDGPQYKDLKMSVGAEDFNMKCLGFVTDMDGLMKQCDFILLFSDHEGLPISLIEATMMGMPIICNDVGGNTEIAINGENSIVVNDWGELLATLNGLPQMDEKTYLSMCQKSREVYEQNFTFERFKRSYLELLNSL